MEGYVMSSPLFIHVAHIFACRLLKELPFVEVFP
jgi:hypothetical protein